MRADLVAIEPRSKCSLKPEPGVGGSAGGVGAAALPGHTAEAGLRAAELQLRPGKSWCHWGRTAGIAALPWALKEQLGVPRCCWQKLHRERRGCRGQRGSKPDPTAGDFMHSNLFLMGACSEL